jgi:Fur family ferric uptake transcriptional regulator
MTAAPEWQAELRARGYRLTPQRQLVLEAVTELGHATPEDIVAKVRQVASGINISTVYRTLELLEELGLVNHAHLGHGAPTYHAASEHAHVHLVCARCDRVEEVPAEVLADVAQQLRVERGFEVDLCHVALSGVCRKCSEGE